MAKYTLIETLEIIKNTYNRKEECAASIRAYTPKMNEYCDKAHMPFDTWWKRHYPGKSSPETDYLCVDSIPELTLHDFLFGWFAVFLYGTVISMLVGGIGVGVIGHLIFGENFPSLPVGLAVGVLGGTGFLYLKLRKTYFKPKQIEKRYFLAQEEHEEYIRRNSEQYEATKKVVEKAKEALETAEQVWKETCMPWLKKITEQYGVETDHSFFAHLGRTIDLLKSGQTEELQEAVQLAKQRPGK